MWSPQFDPAHPKKEREIKKSLSCCIAIFICSSQPSYLFISCLRLHVLFLNLSLSYRWDFLTMFGWLLLILLSSSLHSLFYLFPSSLDRRQLPPSSKVSHRVREQAKARDLSLYFFLPTFLSPHPRSFSSPLGRVFLQKEESLSEVWEDPLSTWCTWYHYIQSEHLGCFSFIMVLFAPLPHLKRVSFTQAAAFLPFLLWMSPPFCLLPWSVTPMGHRVSPPVSSWGAPLHSSPSWVFLVYVLGNFFILPMS